jgi:hypothetical protein
LGSWDTRKWSATPVADAIAGGLRSLGSTAAIANWLAVGHLFKQMVEETEASKDFELTAISSNTVRTYLRRLQ